MDADQTHKVTECFLSYELPLHTFLKYVANKSNFKTKKLKDLTYTPHIQSGLFSNS